ncbi:MAG TPA: hypothetical protein VGR31_06050 [Planctomycetota bacterium]|nr:hypothetical protein [Planctomycetota bacterium]
MIQTAANAPSDAANALLGKKKPTDRVPARVLQSGIMRFADTFSAEIAQAAQEFAKKSGKPEAQVQALTWTVAETTSAVTIASGKNANIALLDMIVLVTFGRRSHEAYWLPQVWGEADRPMLDAFAKLEDEIWAIAKLALNDKQEADMRETLRVWQEENPDMASNAAVRMPTFEEILSASTSKSSGKLTGLGDLLAIDPLAGLEPAVRELEQSRLFAERALFYMQRAPLIFEAQAELLGLKLAQMPEVHAALETSERVSHAAVDLAKTAATLPDSVQQISDALTAQREGIVADLEKIEGPTRDVLKEAHTTFEAGKQLSATLQETIQTFDTLVAHLNAENEPSDGKGASTEPSRPFVVSEYGEAATRLGTAAHDVTGLLTTLDTDLPRLQRVLDESAQRADRTVDHALDRALAYAAVLIGIAACAQLVVLWISRRWLARRGV